MTLLNYRCPNCQQRAEVQSEQVGQIQICAACSHPYQPEVPTGRLLTQRDDGRWAAAGDRLAGGPSANEVTLVMVRPAMFRARPLRYIGLIGGIIIGLAGLIYFGAQGDNSAISSWPRPVALVCGVLFGLLSLSSLAYMVYWLISVRNDTLQITNERTIWERGILDRATSEVQHDDVRNIQIKQTFLERILGVGNIAISSAGQDEMEIEIHAIPDPDAVADKVRACQARMEGRDD